MNRRASTASAKKSRTTLMLPSDFLSEAQRIARNRNVDLSAVVGDALSEALRNQTAAERSEEVLESYKKAFSGFTEDEMAILDGVIIEPPARR